MEVSKRLSPLKHVYATISDYTQRFVAEQGHDCHEPIAGLLRKWRVNMIDEKVVAEVFLNIRAENNRVLYDYVMGGTHYMAMTCSREDVELARKQIIESIAWINEDQIIDEDITSRVAKREELDQILNSKWLIFLILASSLSMSEILGLNKKS